jgi:hypothetical protein
MRSNRCLDPKRYRSQYVSMSFRSSFVRGGAFGRLSLESLGLTSLTILVGQLLHPSDADAIEATTCRQLIVPAEICLQMKRIFVSFSFGTMMKLS